MYKLIHHSSIVRKAAYLRRCYTKYTLCVYVYVCMCMCMYMCVCVYVCMCMCDALCVYVCMYVKCEYMYGNDYQHY